MVTVTNPYEFVDEKTAGARLAYRTTNAVFIARKGGASRTQIQSSTQLFYIEASGTDWYIKSSDKSASIKLPSTAGEWTHISVVFEIDNSYSLDSNNKVTSLGLGNTKAHVYVDGIYLGTAVNLFGSSSISDLDLDTLNTIGFDQIRLQGGSFGSDNSVCLDNAAAHYYVKGYTGDLAADFANGAPKNLFGTTDVVYNGDYVSPNGAVGTVNGTVYNTQSAFLAAISSGATVTLNSNVTMPYAPTASFTVVTNGYKLKLDAAAGYMMKETDTAGTYCVVPATEAKYIIIDATTGDVIKHGLDTSELLSDYASLTAMKVKIILQDNLVITDPNSTYRFVITGGKSLELDLNGYDITQTVNGATPELFRFNGANGAGSVNVYSSKPGSDIISLSSKDGVANGSGIFYIDYVERGTVNITIGNGTNNLTTHTTIFLQSYSKVATNITVNGGRYLTPAANARAYFSFRGVGMHTFNVDNAFFGINGHSLFYVDNASCPVVAKVNNSVLAGNNTVFFNTSNGTYLNNQKTSLTFTNTDIIVNKCSITAGNEGAVVFGEGTRINFEIPTGGAFVTPEGLTAVSYTGDAYDYSYKVWHPKLSTTEPYVFNITEKSVEIKGSYLYEIVDIPEEIEVTWVDEDGNELARETYFEGETARYKGDTILSRVDGSLWIAYGISGWVNERDKDNLVVSAANCTFYAVMGEVVDIQALYNFRTDNNFTRFVYIPVPTADSGIVVTSIYDVKRAEETMGKPSRISAVKINGVSYYRVIDTPGVVGNFVQDYEVTYTRGGVEGKYTVSAGCMAAYFTQVLADEKQCEEAKTLAVNAANYMKAVWTYAGQNTKDLDAILSNNTDRILSISDADIKAQSDSTSIAGLSGIVTGATFVIGDGFTPALAIMMTDTTTAAAGSYVSKSGPVYEFDFQHANYHYTGAEGFDAAVPSDRWSANKLRVTPSIGVYNMRETMTITVGENQGTYSLANYITYMRSLENPTAKQSAGLAVAEALYAYSIASYNYKTRPQTAN